MLYFNIENSHVETMPHFFSSIQSTSQPTPRIETTPQGISSNQPTSEQTQITVMSATRVTSNISLATQNYSDSSEKSGKIQVDVQRNAEFF